MFSVWWIRSISVEVVPHTKDGTMAASNPDSIATCRNVAKSINTCFNVDSNMLDCAVAIVPTDRLELPV